MQGFHHTVPTSCQIHLETMCSHLDYGLAQPVPCSVSRTVGRQSSRRPRVPWKWGAKLIGRIVHQEQKMVGHIPALGIKRDYPAPGTLYRCCSLKYTCLIILVCSLIQ